MVKRLWEWAIVQAESMAETGIVTGLLAAPLLGVVTKEDADSAVVVDMARNILGNPYEEQEADGEGTGPHDGGRSGPPGIARGDRCRPGRRRSGRRLRERRPEVGAWRRVVVPGRRTLPVPEAPEVSPRPVPDPTVGVPATGVGSPGRASGSSSDGASGGTDPGGTSASGPAIDRVPDSADGAGSAPGSSSASTGASGEVGGDVSGTTVPSDSRGANGDAGAGATDVGATDVSATDVGATEAGATDAGGSATP